MRQVSGRVSERSPTALKSTPRSKTRTHGSPSLRSTPLGTQQPRRSRTVSAIGVAAANTQPAPLGSRSVILGWAAPPPPVSDTPPVALSKHHAPHTISSAIVGPPSLSAPRPRVLDLPTPTLHQWPQHLGIAQQEIQRRQIR